MVNDKKGNEFPKTKENDKLSQGEKANEHKALEVNKDNKYVLGGYFSLGLNNFFKTVLLVFAKAGIRVISDNGNIIYVEDKIGQVLNTLYKSTLKPIPPFENFEKAWSPHFKLNSNQQVNLQKLLFHHFPILGPVMADEAAYKVNKNKKSNVLDTYTMTYGVTLPECLKVLSIIAQGLVDCRNANVHYDPYNSIDDLRSQYLVQKDIVRYLIKTLVASRRLDKKRNSIETEKMEFLTGYAKDPKDDAGNSLEKYFNKHGFNPRYEQVIKTDASGNPLLVIVTDEQGNPRKDSNGNPLYKQKKDKFGNLKFNEDGTPDYEVQVKMVERNDFFYRIGGDTTIENDDKVYSTLTGFGLSFFCSIFLTKPQAKQMLADIQLFKNSPYPEDLNDIIRDMLSIYRIRSPRGKKLESSDTKSTLALDMMNELRKCPKELYDILGPDGQKFFEDEVHHPNDRTPEVVKRFRSTDRFPYLAMRYVDEIHLFDNIRFQIQLGKLRFKFKSKICINGEDEIRSLQKEINGFGRIEEIEKRRQEEYDEFLQVAKEKSVKIEGENINLDLLQFEKDKADSKPYITDSKASYNIHNNRIGLNWNEKVIKDKEQKERIVIRQGDYLPSLKDVKEGKAPVEMPAPMAMLSIHELPFLVFYDYLLSKIDKGDKFEKAEDIIINKYHSLRKFFSDVSNGNLTPLDKKKDLMKLLKNGYALEINEIPDKLIKYLTNKKVDIASRRKKITQDKLVEMLKVAIRRKDGFEDDRKMIGSKKNNYGKDSYVDVRHGSLARYLSEAFLEWQPANEKGDNKLTGMNFSKLQAELAIFVSEDKYDLIKKMLEEAGLLSGDFAHPFLPTVMMTRIHNIEELYLRYLDEEIKHIKGLLGIMVIKDKDIKENRASLKKLDTLSFDYTRLPFIKGEARWEERNTDYYKKLAARYLEVNGKRASIWLPDGLFAKPILDILKEKFEGNEILQESLKDEKLNAYTSYLVRMYFEHQLGDGSQPFYNSSDINSNGEKIPNKFAHIYDLFNVLKNQKRQNTYVKVPMTVEDINAKFSTNAKDEYGDFLERTRPNGRPVKINDTTLYKKVIHMEIEQRVEQMTYEDRGNHKNLEEAKEAMRRKLTHLIGEVKDNERAIRRHKVQDMVIFLMAKRLMEKTNAIGNMSETVNFKLQNICNPNYLSQTVDFNFPFQIGADTVHIQQEQISLKNLGEFYQLISDDRLPSLLERLLEFKKKKQKALDFGYSELMGELASYDIHRSRIFNAIHQLEKYVVSNDKFDFLYDPNDIQFYMKNDKDEDPKRNNFISLLELLETANIQALTKEERELANAIRNAFSHNHYKVCLNEVANDTKLSKTTLLHTGDSLINKKEELTTLATLIKNKLEELQKKVEDYTPQK